MTRSNASIYSKSAPEFDNQQILRTEIKKRHTILAYADSAIAAATGGAGKYTG